MGCKILKRVTWPWPRRCQGIFFIGRVGLAIVSQCTKFEVSRFTRYESINGSAKCRKWGGYGALKVMDNATIACIWCTRRVSPRSNFAEIFGVRKPDSLGSRLVLFMWSYPPVWARGRCRISPPRFLAECCKRQLNQVSLVLLYFRSSAFSDLYWVCLSVFSCTVLFVSISPVTGCEDRLRNDLYCVGWGVKLYSNKNQNQKKHSPTHTHPDHRTSFIIFLHLHGI